MDKRQYEELKAQQEIHWWFVGKKEIVIDFAIKQAGLRKENSQQKILDVGCGMGLMLEALSEYGQVYGVDMAEEAVQYCNESLANRGAPKNVFKGSLPYDVPFQESSFDFIFALDVIEHVEDDQGALVSLYRLLKPGGKLIITVPALMSMWSYNDELNHHFRRYEKKELKDKVVGAKFSIIKCSFYNSHLFVFAWIVRNIKRAFKIEKSDVIETTKNSLPNKILKNLFVSEKKHLQTGEYRIGVSLILACQKEQ